MPVERDTVNSAVPRHAATTIAEASHHGIDRHRSITMPSAIPTPKAANFHGNPGEGAGYITSGDTQNRNTGDRFMPGGHLRRGIIRASNASAHHHDDGLADTPSVTSLLPRRVVAARGPT